MASGASSTPVILNFVFRIGSSHSGPSRVPQLKPCLILSCTLRRSFLSVVDGRVSSTKMLGPISSGPNAQILRADNLSQSYFSSKNFATARLPSLILTTPDSISSAIPSSSGSATMVILLRPLGVLAKHMIADCSETVSQKRVTGSDTLISISA